jgi:hypothetical protein
MSALMLAVALASASPEKSGEKVSVRSLGQAESEVRSEIQTGTLLVTEGDCLAIRIYTQSPYTHVAAVVVRNGKPFVYDSANGVGVRCSTLKNYLSSQSPSEIHVFQPKHKFSRTKSDKLESWLDSQLGRPYAISHHLSGERSSGLHCSEYVMDAMQHCGVLKAKRPSRVSPASLVTGITHHRLYSKSMVVQVEPPKPTPQTESDSWCGSLWNDTKTCTADCYRKTKGWIFCR